MLGDHRRAGPEVVERQAARVLVVGGHDARLQHIAVEMDVDRAAGDRPAEALRQVVPRADVRDGVAGDQLFLEAVEVALADQHDPVEPEAGAEARSHSPAGPASASPPR